MRLAIGIDGTVAMIALRSTAQVTVDELTAAFVEMFPHEPRLQIDDDGGVLNIEFGDERVFVTPEPDPIPWGFLEEPCTTSPIWTQATDEMRRHSAHVLVLGNNVNGDRLAQCMAVTRVSAALLQCTDSVGVYWNSAPLVAPADMFRDLAREMTHQRLPLDLWIDFCAGGDSSGAVHGYTSGLAGTGHMELEIVDSHREPSEVARVLFEVAHYLLEFTPELFDGSTIGVGNNEQVRILRCESAFRDGDRVIQLLFEGGV